MNKQNILFIIDTFGELAGAEKNLYLAAKEFKKKDYNPIVCILKAGHLINKLKEQKITFIDLNIDKIYNIHGIKQILKLIKFIRQHHIKLVVTYHESSDFIGFIIKILTGIPVISNRRDMGYKLKRRHIIVYHIINNFFDHIVCVSQAVKKIIIKREDTPSKRLSVIYNGLNISRYLNVSNDKIKIKTKLGITPQDKVVSMIAGIRRIKGHEYFIKAAHIILKEMPNVKFLLVGHDNQEINYSLELKRLIEKLGISQNMLFLGHRDDIPKILSITDISVLSSLSEGFSNTIIESMAAGVPVVATNVGGNPESIVHGVTGFLVPPKNTNALASAILKLLKDKNLAKKMGEAARKRAKDLFSLNKMIDNYETLIKATLGNNQRCHFLPINFRKMAKLFVADFLYYSGLFHLFLYLRDKTPSQRGIRILAYHRVDDDIFYHQIGLAVSSSNFEKQMFYLKKYYNIISLKDALYILKNGLEIPPRAIVITFDDGYKDNYINAFPVLKKYNIPATIFLCVNPINNGTYLWPDQIINVLKHFSANYLDLRKYGLDAYTVKTLEEKKQVLYKICDYLKKTSLKESQTLTNYLASTLNEGSKNNLMLDWEEINEMKKYNISFGSHTLTHPILTEIPIEEAMKEIRESKKIIEDRLRETIDFFAYPYGSKKEFNDQIIKLLKDTGYSCACTLISGPNKKGTNLYTLKRYSINEGMSTNLLDKFSPALFATHLADIFQFLNYFRNA